MFSSIFEAGMMICFGSSWPMSLWKMWSTGSSEGVSMRFLFLVFLGYLCGITHKILYSPDWVLWMYVLNAVMVFLGMVLCMKNRIRTRKHTI